MRLVLASASPRRRALMAAAGFDVDVDPADVDERRLPGESPRRYVERLAREKATVVAARHPGRTVLAADTAVVVDGDVLGKPEHAVEAARMLERLSGRAHEVLTGVAMACDGRVHAAVDATVVWMRALTPEEIQAYIATGEPADKAGAYAIQGGAAPFVTRVDGAHDTVVGLPIATVKRLLAGLGQSGAGVVS